MKRSEPAYAGDGIFSISKGGSRQYGGINTLLNDEPIENVLWSISMSARGYELSENGTKPYTSALVDNASALVFTRLKKADRTFDGFRITNYTLYDAGIDTVSYSYKPVANTEYDKYPELAVYYSLESESEDWILAGHIKMIVQDNVRTYEYTDTNNQTTVYDANTYIMLPVKAGGIKFEQTGTQYQISLGASLTSTIYPSETLKDGLANFTERDITNYVSGYLYDEDGKRYTGNGSNARARLTKFTGSSSGRKRVVSGEKDLINESYKIAYRLYQYDEVEAGSVPWADIVEVGAIKEYRNGTFYDLLPRDAEVDLDTMKVYQMSGFNNTGSNVLLGDEYKYTVDFVKNWENSHRTMMIVRVSVPDGKDNYVQGVGYYKQRAYTGFVLDYSLSIPNETLRDYGTNVLNSSAFVSEDGISNGSTTKIIDEEYFSDLDQDGIADENENSYKTQIATTAEVPSNNQAGFKKSVKGSEDSRYVAAATTAPGSDYTYKIVFQNDHPNDVEDVILYDILEKNYGDSEYWSGTFNDVDISQPLAKGINAVVYYSTNPELKVLAPGSEKADLTNSTYWTTQKPEDLSTVTAIAVDCRRLTDGSKKYVSQYERVVIEIGMKAPSDVEGLVDLAKTDEDETVYAYNNAYASITKNDDLELTSTGTVTTRIVKDDIAIHKTSDPESGTSEAPALVDNKAAITYTLQVVNGYYTNSDVVVEDDIPQALTVQDNQVQYQVDDGEWISVEDSDLVTYSNEDNHIRFAISTILSEQKISFKIPTTVKADTEEGTKIENTAKITEVNEEDTDIESETTYHQTKYSITFNKEWDDDEDNDRIRPQSVRVQLLADGKEVGDKVELSEENKWSYTFTNLLKYSGDKEIVYTIEEEDVDGYEPSLNGTTLTNTHEPETVSIPVEKVWMDDENSDQTRPESIQVTLYADGEPTDDTLTLSEENEWMGVFENIRKYNDGEEIVYTIEENVPDKYSGEIAGSAEDGYTITNTVTEIISIDVTKEWIGEPSDSITIRLAANGEEIESYEMTADDEWQYTFENLDRYDTEGKRIEYTLSEDEISGYESEITGDADTGFVITNTANDDGEDPSDGDDEDPSDDGDDDEDPSDDGNDDDPSDQDDNNKPAYDENKPSASGDPTKPGRSGRPFTGTKTGDYSNMMIYLVMLLSAVTAVSVLIRKRKRG